MCILANKRNFDSGIKGEKLNTMFSNKKILEIAMEQSAWDIGAKPEDFLNLQNVLVDFKLGENARKYLKEPICANLVSYGNAIVAATGKENRIVIEDYIGKFEWYHCLETPNANWLLERLAPLGQKICFMAEYFLPDVNKLKRLDCGYELKVLTQADFADLYKPEWSNALCENRKELDCLGVGAYDGEKLIGFAACSADAQKMWQIGVDVLPDYRRQGIAASLTSNLAMEILERGKVPFYCCAWSNVRSARNAIKSGFVPSWVEMTIKPANVVDEMNK